MMRSLTSLLIQGTADSEARIKGCAGLQVEGT